MPFRLPHNIESFNVWNRDPTESELTDYIAWLERELSTAKVALEELQSQNLPDTAPEK